MKKAITTLSIVTMAIAVVAFVLFVIGEAVSAILLLTEMDHLDWKITISWLILSLNYLSLLVFAAVPLLTAKMGSWAEIAVVAIRLFVAPLVPVVINLFSSIFNVYVELNYYWLPLGNPLSTYALYSLVGGGLAELASCLLSIPSYMLGLGYALLLVTCGMSIAYKFMSKKAAALPQEEPAEEAEA